MKLYSVFLSLSFLSLVSFANEIKSQNYLFTPPACNKGEVAYVKSIKGAFSNDGSFIVNVQCRPALCFIGFPKDGVRKVSLYAMVGDGGMSSYQTIGEIRAASKAEARDDAQKFINQGLCRELYFDSKL